MILSVEEVCELSWKIKSKNNKVVVISGYFDPLHIGHIEYIKQAKLLGTTLIIIVNSDLQAKLKKGKPFMSCNERMVVVDSLIWPDFVVESIDEDATVCRTLEALRPDIFAKGGDRDLKLRNIPEYEICLRNGIDLVDGLGKKIQSSSSLIKAANEI